MGAGGCRLVYEIDERRVIKLAVSTDGLAQNKQEYLISKDWQGDHITKVLDHDPERCAWLISERAVPFENIFPFDGRKLDTMFHELMDVGPNDFSRALEHITNHVHNPHPESVCYCREEVKKHAFRLREENQWFKDFLGNIIRIKDANPSSSRINLAFDLHEYNMGYISQGKEGNIGRIKKRIVILDYGLLAA